MDALLTELLLQHNCVIIPDFGGFVASRIPAYIDQEKGKVFPPSKQLTFNARLVKNDGLLIAALAEKESITYDSALEKIKLETQSVQQKLRKGLRHTIENIGTLYLNEEGRINFQQDRFFNLLLESYGFGAVEFIPKEQTKQNRKEPDFVQPLKKVALPKAELDKTEHSKKATETKERETPVKPIRSKSKKHKLLKYAAAAAILPLAFYSFWIPMTSDVLQSRVLFKEDFNPFKKNVVSTYMENKVENLTPDLYEEERELKNLQENLPENVNVFHYALTEDVYTPVWRKQPGLSAISEPIDLDNKTAFSGVENDAKYHLIAGCFREIENANGLIEKLQSEGLNAYILDKKEGLHRVTASQINNKSLLSNEKNLLSQKGIKTWVLKK